MYLILLPLLCQLFVFIRFSNFFPLLFCSLLEFFWLSNPPNNSGNKTCTNLFHSTCNLSSPPKKQLYPMLKTSKDQNLANLR